MAPGKGFERQRDRRYRQQTISPQLSLFFPANCLKENRFFVASKKLKWRNLSPKFHFVFEYCTVTSESFLKARYLVRTFLFIETSPAPLHFSLNPAEKQQGSEGILEGKIVKCPIYLGQKSYKDGARFTRSGEIQCYQFLDFVHRFS